MKNYFLDCETYQLKEDNFYYPILDTNHFILGGIIDEQNNIEYFKTPEEMYQSIIQKMKEAERENDICTFWGHNHEYDFYAYIKAHLKELLKQNKIIIVKTNPLLAFINSNLSTKGKEKHVFSDTMSYFHESLESIGNTMNYHKGHMPEKIQKAEELIPYLEQDLRVTKEIITRMKEIYAEIGFYPKRLLTASATSMQNFITYTSRQKKAGWIINKGRIHKYEETIPFLRQANKGARTQVFQEGKFKFAYKIDLNSAYWKEMEEMPFPDLLKERHYTKDILNMIGYDTIKNKEGVVEATIKFPKIKLGILPVRVGSEKEYTLEFPNKECTIRGTWAIIEINYALEKGYKIEELHEAVIYEKNLDFSPLKEYIEMLWNLRKKYKENKFANKVIKLSGNGLYGKFIQRKTDYEYKYIERHELQNYIEQGWEAISAQDDYIIRRKEKAYIAAYVSIYLGLRITAGTRIRLLKEMEKLPKADLLYCDTDAIIFKGRNNLGKFRINSEELGAFKIEAKGPANIASEKVYYVGEDIHIAGLSKKQHSKDIIDKNKEITQLKMTGFKEAIRVNNFDIIGKFTENKYVISAKEDKEIPIYYEEVKNNE